MPYSGINFRATSGYVTDSGSDTYCLGEAYPTSRGGLTFGFGTNKTADARDRSTGVDARLAGSVGQANASGTSDFRLDLPSGAGTYNIRLALGDAGFQQNNRCLILDGSGGSTLATIDADTLTGQWVDASGVVRFSSSGWAADNVSLELTFTASHLILRIGSDASGTFSTTIAHVAVEVVSAGDVTAPVLSSPTGTATGSTTATVGATTDEGNGTMYAFVSTSATPPSAADLKAGTGAVWSGSQAISTTGAKTFSATGLTASTGYYAHLIHTDAAANDSNIVSSAQFTTSAANNAPSWSGTPSAMSSKRGQALTPQDITSLVSDADLDTLTYSITGAPTGVTINSSTGVISGTPTAAPGVYACTVEADDGIASPVSSSSFNITVTQCVLALNSAGYEFGDGNAPATMSVVASTELQVAAYPLTEWPPASAIATATATTGTNGRLADLGDDDLSFGTTYRVIARNAADGNTWAWTMAAS